MATKIGDLFFDVYADVSRATKNVEGLGDKFKSVGGAAARAIGQTVANATAIAVAGTAALTAQVIDAGAAYNVLGQSATAAFTTVFEDLRVANTLLKEISTLNLETPFRGSSLVRTARTLAGFGVEQENVLRITEALTEALAGMGLGSAELQRVAIQFGQIQSRGRLAGDEARALANYGIDAFGIMADALGLSVEQVRKLSEEFKLTSEVAIPALIAGIEDKFGGATERLFNTAAGQAEGLRATFEAVGSALVQPFIGFSGGGALVEAMSAVRLELVQLVGVAEDGSFVLRGFLEPLSPILESVAGSTERAAMGFAMFLGSLDSSTLASALSELDGLGPLLAGAGGALATVFAQAIPFLGRFVAGFNPIVVGVTALIVASSSLRSEFSSAFQDIGAAVQPLVPQVQELLRNIMLLAEDAGPAIADILVTSVEGLAPALLEVLSAVNALLPVVGPILVVALEALAVVLQLIVDILEILGPDVVVVTAGLIAFAHAFPAITAAAIIATSSIGATGAAATLAATAFGTLAAAVGVALAALGAYRAISAGIRGDIDFLSEDVSFFEKPFQLAGRAGFALGGGDRARAQLEAEQNSGFEAAEQFNLALLGQVETFKEARLAAVDYAETIGLTGDGIVNFSNTVALAWREVEEAERSAIQVGVTGAAHLAQLERFAEIGATDFALPVEKEDIDLLKELGDAANRAWDAVDRLARVGSDAVVDDFLRSLPALAEDLTEALGGDAGILRDLDVSGVLGDIREQAVSVIQTLAKEYGVGVGEIRALLDERGLAAVIEALGQVNLETAETVDPLVAKYAELGASADQIRDALSRLNETRQTAIRAQIDQVEAALRDARQSAEDARAAVEEFLSGGYLNSPQALVDKLIGDVGTIGSAVEEALALGGVRGEAAVRTALGGLQAQLAAIVNAGMEAGLSGAQITDLVRPVITAIDEELGDASNRISSLDWTAGFTSGAGQELFDALQAGLDPAAIQRLINNILGADATVAGLESQLEGLQAALQTEVEFSPEQVQAALAEIHTETMVEAVITPEAAQLVLDEIQRVFDDEDLEASVDQALVTQQLMDAAQAAEDEISLVFKSGLSFNSAELHEVARLVGDEFYAGFTQKLRELRDEQAREAGFDSFAQMQMFQDANGANDRAGQTSIQQTINQDITVDGAREPIATASEVVAASSAAAGSGGQYDPSKYFTPVGGPR